MTFLSWSFTRSSVITLSPSNLREPRAPYHIVTALRRFSTARPCPWPHAGVLYEDVKRGRNLVTPIPLIHFLSAVVHNMLWITPLSAHKIGFRVPLVCARGGDTKPLSPSSRTRQRLGLQVRRLAPANSRTWPSARRRGNTSGALSARGAGVAGGCPPAATRPPAVPIRRPNATVRNRGRKPSRAPIRPPAGNTRPNGTEGLRRSGASYHRFVASE
jgi:hypothetical protein